MPYIQIDRFVNETDATDSTVYEINTDAQRKEAKTALRAAGLSEAKVWTGEPGDPGSYETGQVLFAD